MTKRVWIQRGLVEDCLLAHYINVMMVLFISRKCSDLVRMF